jgi:hypothetical protein
MLQSPKQMGDQALQQMAVGMLRSELHTKRGGANKSQISQLNCHAKPRAATDDSDDEDDSDDDESSEAEEGVDTIIEGGMCLSIDAEAEEDQASAASSLTSGTSSSSNNKEKKKRRKVRRYHEYRAGAMSCFDIYAPQSQGTPSHIKSEPDVPASTSKHHMLRQLIGCLQNNKKDKVSVDLVRFVSGIQLSYYINSVSLSLSYNSPTLSRR